MISFRRTANRRLSIALLGVILFLLLAPWSKAHAAAYIIDWDHPNTGLFIFGQGTPTALAFGNVLNASDGSDSGYDFTLALVINDSFGLTPNFTPGSPLVGDIGSQFGVFHAQVQLADRDATTKVSGALTLSGGSSGFANLNLTFLDIDRAPADGAVDQLDVLFGGGLNTYTYNPATISQSGDSFTGLATVPSTSSDGNVQVDRVGLTGNVINFEVKSGSGDTFSDNQDFGLSDASFDIVVVPEPSGVLLLTLGTGLILRRRRAAARR